MRRQVIEVTQADIDAGRVGSGTGCPVSHALKRQIPALMGDGVEVSSLGLTQVVYERGQPVRVRSLLILPYVVVKAIQSYDATGVMRPFAFELELDDDREQRTGESASADAVPETSLHVGGVEDQGRPEMAGDGDVYAGGSESVGGLVGDQPRG
jgi:hypothetical protein